MGSQPRSIIVVIYVCALGFTGQSSRKTFRALAWSKSVCTQDEQHHYKHLEDDRRIAKLAYMTDMFEHLNELSIKMQGKSENILSSGPSPAGGPVVHGPPIWNRWPPFHVWSPGCYIHPMLYFENVAPLLVFGSPHAKSWRRAWLSCSDRLKGFKQKKYSVKLNYHGKRGSLEMIPTSNQNRTIDKVNVLGLF